MKKIIRAIIRVLILGIGIFLASSVHAAANVYYSVGQSATDLSNNGSSQTCTVGGDCTLTISGGTATFNFAQTGNIGVGDRVTYNTTSIAYISGKISQTQWTLVTATGGTPANVTDQTVNSITREYTSLSAAEAGASDANHINNISLIAADVVLNLPCYYDTGADTAAVTIDGWTTDATRYIWIYTPNNTATESNQSQRHGGMWNTEKYRLEVSGTSAIEVRANYVEIEGIQIDKTSTGYPDFGIYGSAITNAGSLTISRNIIKRNPGSSTISIGIRFYDTDWTSYIYNNIIYDFNNAVNGDFGVNWRYSGTSYVYNNTFQNNAVAVGRHTTNGGTVYLKNNLFSDSYGEVGYGDTVGMVAADCDYNATNLSSLGYTAQAHDRVSQTFSFVDAPNFDFHLSEDDTAALDAGTDLSSDFSTDIDGNTRTGTWDIGADEFGSATPLYRSVGTTATNLNTDSRTVTIAGTTATFSDAMPNNIGVGDVFQYQVTGTYYLAFIYERRSPTVYRVRSATAGAPQAAAAGTSVGVYRAYTLQGGQGPLYNWEEQDENDNLDNTVENFDTSTDLVANDTIMNAACYGDGADTTAVTIDGWTTGADNYIHIYTPRYITEVGTSQRHSGKWDGAKYSISLSGESNNLVIRDSYVRVEGLQISVSSGNYNNLSGIRIEIAGTSNIYIGNNIIRNGNTGNTGRYGILVSYATSAPCYIYNNTISSFSNTGSCGIYLETSAGTEPSFVYNNTVADCATGINTG